MRRIVLALCMTATSLVLLFGYRTSLPGNTAPTAASTSVSAPVGGAATDPSAGAVTAPSGTATPAPSAGTTPPAPAGGTKAGTFAGSAVQTRWGPVQVQITVSGSKITSVKTLQVPAGNQRDAEINAAAVPRLNKEVVSAQSAQIDSVSGATVTSDGYISSLQSAIDAAGL